MRIANVSGLLKAVCDKVCGLATLRWSAVVMQYKMAVCGQLTGSRQELVLFLP